VEGDADLMFMRVEVVGTLREVLREIRAEREF
jgi:hypothetical protein